MVTIDEATREHNKFVFRKVFGNCMDRDTLKNTLISTFLYIMDNEEFDDNKKMDLVELMHEIAHEYDPGVMAEGLPNYLIARH